jgi:hypothetical protein
LGFALNRVILLKIVGIIMELSEKERIGKERKNSLHILLVTIAFIWISVKYGYPYIMDNLNKIAYEIEEQKIKDQLSHYIEFDIKTHIPKDWEGTESDGYALYTTKNGKRYSVECDTKVMLKEKDVIKYVTTAPMGMLMQYGGKWYIAKVSSAFSSKKDVEKHLDQCIPKLEEEIERELAKEKSNIISWKK